MTALQERTIAVASQLIGQREARRRNDGPFVRMVLRFAGLAEGLPWCVAFATYVVHRAGKEIGVRPKIPPSGSSSSLYRWCRLHNLTGAPNAGCLGFVRGGRTGHSHTCIVIEVQGGEAQSIDGNWRNAVSRTRRPVASMDYARIE